MVPFPGGPFMRRHTTQAQPDVGKSCLLSSECRWPSMILPSYFIRDFRRWGWWFGLDAWCVRGKPLGLPPTTSCCTPPILLCFGSECRWPLVSLGSYLFCLFSVWFCWFGFRPWCMSTEGLEPPTHDELLHLSDSLVRWLGVSLGLFELGKLFILAAFVVVLLVGPSALECPR